MMKLFRKFFWIFMIVLQSLLGVGAGLLFLSSVSVDTVSTNTKMGGLAIDGLSLGEAKTAITSYYEDLINKGSLIVEINQKPFKLAYLDFDVVINIDKTFENLKKSVPQNGFELFFAESKKMLVLKPAFNYNSGKLLAQCETLFSQFEKAPVPERYEVQDGVLKFIPQISGRNLDYPRLEQELKEKMFAYPQEPYRIDTQTTPLFLEAKSESLYKEPFTILISKAQVPLEPGLEEKVQGYLQPFQNAVFEKSKQINLNSLLDFSQFTSDVEKDLLNRIATALYQSALPIDEIKVLNRKPSQRAVSYTEPGLEAVIEGKGANLIMNNETDGPLMLLTDVTDSTITFYMASTIDLKSGILITQKKDQVPPPIITSVNKALAPNVTKVISEGVPGYTVYVSRLIDDDRVELYHDRYQPVSKIVETGEKPFLTSSK